MGDRSAWLTIVFVEESKRKREPKREENNNKLT